MNHFEFRRLLSQIHPEIREEVEEALREDKRTTELQKTYSALNNLFELFLERGAALGPEILAEVGCLVELGLAEGDEDLDTAISTSLLEAIAHWIERETPEIIPVLGHIGPRAFAYIKGYLSLGWSGNDAQWTCLKWARRQGARV